MPTAEKLDLYKVHKAEYVAPKKPVLVKTARAKYLSITGRGAPASAEFRDSVGTLYGVAYTIKMTRKFAGNDYRVCPLEGFYWGSEGEDVATVEPKDWNWTLVIRVPDFVQPRDLAQAVTQLRAKGKTGEFARVEFTSVDEGQCVQMLHVGPYDQERKTVDQMLDFARQKGLTCRGKHHEIYLSDPNRVPPARLRTILRFPVAA